MIGSEQNKLFQPKKALAESRKALKLKATRVIGRVAISQKLLITLEEADLLLSTPPGWLVRQIESDDLPYVDLDGERLIPLHQLKTYVEMLYKREIRTRAEKRFQAREAEYKLTKSASQINQSK